MIRVPRLVLGALNDRPALVSLTALSIRSDLLTGSKSVHRRARISLRLAPVSAAVARTPI
jgi:hypothetical protein